MNSLHEVDWKALVRPGARVFIGSGAACPLPLMGELLPHLEHVSDVEIVHASTLGATPWIDRRYADAFKVNGFYLSRELCHLVKEGVNDFVPAFYTDLVGYFRDGRLAPDVALIMVSPADAYGYHSLGVGVDFAKAACEMAGRVVAMVNPRMPVTMGDSFLHASEIDVGVEVEVELEELARPELSGVEKRIGRYVAQIIEDGSTLQAGTSGFAEALLASLGDHRDLGIHTEVFSDGMRERFLDGVITNARKAYMPGKMVASAVLGTRELYDFVDGNAHLHMMPVERCHDLRSIAMNERMVAVNSAAMADLSGQLVVDSVDGRESGGLGGYLDFWRGASLAREGMAVAVLASTGADGGSSNIRVALPAGSGVGQTRAEVAFIVTEYGVAALRGRSLRERVIEMVQVAHPQFREEILREARSHHLIPSWFSLPPPYEEQIEGGLPVERISLKDGDYLLRPLTPSDGRYLQAFFYSHTEDTIHQRYGFMVKRMSPQRAFELVSVDQNRDLALGIFEEQGPRLVLHAVGRYYLDANGRGAEVAFVTRESKRRVGMARVLFETMVKVAKARGLDGFWAQVDRENLGMLKLFEAYGARADIADDMKTVKVVIPFKPEPEAEKRRQYSILPSPRAKRKKR